GAPEPLPEPGKFSATGDFQHRRRIQIGTAGATTMAVDRADDEFSSAAAGFAEFFASFPVPFPPSARLGHRYRRPPKFVPCLIGCFCHRSHSSRSLSDRKRITKASCYKDSTCEQAEGRAARPAGKNYVIQPGFSHCARPDWVAAVL